MDILVTRTERDSQMFLRTENRPCFGVAKASCRRKQRRSWHYELSTVNDDSVVFYLSENRTLNCRRLNHYNFMKKKSYNNESELILQLKVSTLTVLNSFFSHNVADRKVRVSLFIVHRNSENSNVSKKMFPRCVKIEIFPLRT